METMIQNKPHKFSITLKENDTNSCTYRVNRKLYDTLKVYLVVKFTGSTVGSAVTHSGGKFALVYNQS